MTRIIAFSQGVWPRTCVLLFQPEISSAGTVALQLCMRYEKEAFEEALACVKDVYAISEEIFLDWNSLLKRPLGDADLEDLNWPLEAIFEPRLAASWHRFVDSDARLEKKERELIRLTIDREAAAKGATPQDLQIIDAAMGLGTESVALLGDQLNVKSNEIDWTLIGHALEYAQSKE